MSGEDIFILLKILAIRNHDWTPVELSYELDTPLSQIEHTLVRLKKEDLLHSDNRPDYHRVKDFLLQDLPVLYPARPGKLSQGILTGAKPGSYFCIGLPYSSIWVWPHEGGPNIGYEIEPLSSKCCFAVYQDQRLKEILAITETLRVAGANAQVWAQESFKQIDLF
jgi:hypothetical protein